MCCLVEMCFSPAAAAEDVRDVKQSALESFTLSGFILCLASVGITDSPLFSIVAHSQCNVNVHMKAHHAKSNGSATRFGYFPFSKYQNHNF